MDSFKYLILYKSCNHSGVVQFDPKTGKQFKKKSSTLSYTQYFAESLIKEAEADDKIVAIHAAMGGGTGLNYFQKRFPERCFDVGIAEQHAVTFAAGLATEGIKPFCAIYSSFLQRGFDQVSIYERLGACCFKHLESQTKQVLGKNCAKDYFPLIVLYYPNY